ncbi:hypothetical protein FISHEDRAFT_46965 [Fistulina hepatica ATCC 64428]|uniref:F-box domain-containing protein n=1 Tax=Fistulina hepatica ATCC 64428 TaxID=1128425 RepID=A0A0D7A741_9AGAR|nr:hypothetical protein FISHEDRAFT_46965 [Fistulina hepatica ATCC 64428]
MEPGNPSSQCRSEVPTDQTLARFTGYPPPLVYVGGKAIDVGQVQSAIIHHEAAVLEINQEIEQLLAVARRLEYQKSRHMEEMRRCKGLITLARRIPPEILVYIFELCVDWGFPRTPISVSQVCSEWRAAAVCAATLWSHVLVSANNRNPYCRALLWLNRAQSAPLHVTVQLNGDTSHVSGALGVLLERRGQWRTLTIQSYGLAEVDGVLTVCKGAFPDLRSITVQVEQDSHSGRFFSDVNNDEDGVFLMGLRDSFSPAPLCETMAFKAVIFPPLQSLPLNLVNLSISLLPSSVNLRRLHIASLVGLVDQLRSLQSLAIILPFGENYEIIVPPQPITRATAPVLLRLNLTGPLHLFTLLHHLETPALMRLQLRSSLEPEISPHEPTSASLRECIGRSTPPLELLELHDVDLTEECFVFCFDSLPTLQEVRLHESDISDQVVQRLGTGACPRLRRLDLRWCGRVRGDALVSMVQHRSQSGDLQSLELITVINCTFIKDENVLDLARFTRCSLMIRQDDDYCQSWECCSNERYRRRLQLRKLHDLEMDHRHNIIF